MSLSITGQENTAPTSVLKRDGTVQPFDASKIHRWAEYAAKQRVDWHEVAEAVVARLPSSVSTQEIHQAMIDYCLAKETLEHSRVASQLVYAQIRKNMRVKLAITDQQGFKDIVLALGISNLWTRKLVDEILANIEKVEGWYRYLYPVHLES